MKHYTTLDIDGEACTVAVDYHTETLEASQCGYIGIAGTVQVIIEKIEIIPSDKMDQALSAMIKQETDREARAAAHDALWSRCYG